MQLCVVKDNLALGRYISSDPIGIEGGLNTFLYANASPVMYSDPEGLHVVMPGIPPIPPIAMPDSPAQKAWKKWSVEQLNQAVSWVKEKYKEYEPQILRAILGMTGVNVVQSVLKCPP